MLYALDCNMILPVADAARVWEMLVESWSSVDVGVGEQAPSLTALRRDTAMVSAGLKFADIDARDTVVMGLNAHKDSVILGSSGFICSHNCSHDEGGGCSEVRADAWGTKNG